MFFETTDRTREFDSVVSRFHPCVHELQHWTSLAVFHLTRLIVRLSRCCLKIAEMTARSTSESRQQVSDVVMHGPDRHTHTDTHTPFCSLTITATFII